MADSSTLVDRVKIFSESSGTGPFVLGNALPAFRGVEALVDGLTYSYAVENGSDYEAGQCVYVEAVNQLLRTPSISSNGGAAVPFPANVAINFTALAADLTAGLAGTGTVRRVSGSGGTTGLTLTGGPILVEGTLELGGVLAVEHGGTGADTLSGFKTAIGLGNVDNTSDADKPMSGPQLAALATPAVGETIGLLPDSGIATDLGTVTDRLPVWAENYATIQAAFNAASAREAPLQFRPGVTYAWPATPVVVTGKVKVIATGATFTVADAITALTFAIGAAGSEWDGGTWEYTGPKTTGYSSFGGYNAASNAILVTGTQNGPGVAPTFIENVVIKNATFNGFGNTALEVRYGRYCRDEKLRVFDCGYAGVFCYSVDVYRSDGLFVNGLAGQLDTGNPVTSELNAYGFTATALTGGSPDRIQDPYSRNVFVNLPVIVNVPTWHAIDTHGADSMTVFGAEIRDCRRGVIFTGLTDRGPSNCRAVACSVVNNLSPGAINTNTSFKKGEAYWDVGASGSLRSSFNRFENCDSFGMGNPNAGASGGFANSGDGAVTIANADDGFYDIRDVQSYYVGWKFGADVERATISARSTNTHHATATPSVARIEGNNINLRIANWQCDAKDASVDTNVMVNGIVVVNTNTGGSIHFEAFDLTACTGGELISSGGGSTIAATLTGNFSLPFDITMTGVTVPPTHGIRLSRQGRVCSAQIPINLFTGTSNAPTLTQTGFPANFRPSGDTATTTISALDGGANFVLAYGVMDSSGVLTWTRDADSNTSNWTPTGAKTLRGGLVEWMV